MNTVREECRRAGHRARARLVKRKADQLYKLIESGASEQATASALGYSLKDTWHLLELVQEGRGEGSR